MTRVPMKAILGTVALGALVGGCATTVEMGPGYYHYDVGVARPTAPAVVREQPVVVRQEPAVVIQEPAVVYREPAVVYRDNSTFVYREPTIVYRDSSGTYLGPTVYRLTPSDSAPYKDHAQ
jgi:hypothetical protein